MSKRVLLAVPAVLAAAALTGCGTSHPGVAASVGDEQILLEEVDAVTDTICTAIANDPQAQGPAFPRKLMRQQLVSVLVARSAAEQIAEEHGLEPGAEYDEQVRQYRDGLKPILPEGDLETVVQALTAPAYRDGIVTAMGRRLLAGTGATPTTELAQEKGQEFYAGWLDDHGVELDPRFGVTLQEVEVRPGDTDTSVAVSEAARAALAAEPDPAYTASLPRSQRCGDRSEAAAGQPAPEPLPEEHTEDDGHGH